MAIALVSGQVASSVNAGSTTTQAAVLPNNPTTGNLVVVAFVAAGTASNRTYTCADSNSNTYTATSKTTFNATTGNSMGVFYLQNAPANASKTITVTLSGSAVSANTISVWAIEFSGAATTSVFENDATIHNTVAGTTINTPTYTSLNNGDVYVACCLAGGTISTANSPWTGIDIVRNGNYAEYYIQTSLGAQAVAYTQTSAAWDGIVAAFKAAAAAAALPIGWVQPFPTPLKSKPVLDLNSGWVPQAPFAVIPVGATAPTFTDSSIQVRRSVLIY